MHKNVFIFIKIALWVEKDDAGTAGRIGLFCGKKNYV